MGKEEIVFGEDRQSRSLGLDVVRSLAIGSVLACHISLLHGVLFPSSVPVTTASTLLGYYGVELFFVLSGFLIGGILFNEVLPNPSLSVVGRFFARRWLRILPAYYAVLLLLTVLEGMHGAPVALRWDYLFFLQNYDQGAISFFPVSWSLTIEQWSYLLAPVVLLLVPPVFVPLAPQRHWQIWLSLLALFGLILSLRLGTALFTDATWDMGIRKQIHLRLDAVFFGVAIVSCKHFKRACYDRLASLPFFLLILVGLFLLVRFQAAWMITHDAPGGPDSSLFFKTLGFTLTNLLLALTLPFFAAARCFVVMVGSAPRLFRFFSAGSRYAYGLYLVHFTVFAHICPVLARVQAASLPLRLVAFGLAAVAALLFSWGLAMVLHHAVEKPGMDLRRHFAFHGKKGG